ncbi:MAG: hypothetical protein OXH86_13970 [Acidimicrobiaceae bacterium]|nr:hypothetical protein [Acidimicrobiaceae bacterium]
MSQLGKPDDQYVRARRALPDAAIALDDHLDAVVLVGAQALYLHTGDADLAVAEFTTDADLVIHPNDIADDPLIADLLEPVGFSKDQQPGQWLSPDRCRVDLMVPEQLAGSGTRGAALGAHGRHTARRARGLEATLVDCQRATIKALDPVDARSVEMNVAGPGALLVAKVHKIADRSTTPDRLSDKDALDVLRLLQCVPIAEFTSRIQRLQAHKLSGDVTDEAILHMGSLFGTNESVGVGMAVRAAVPLESADVIASSITILARDLLEELNAGTRRKRPTSFAAWRSRSGSGSCTTSAARRAATSPCRRSMPRRSSR